MSQISPAPWFVGNGNNITDANGREIAYFYRLFVQGEGEANALLVASTPELLDFVKRATDFFYTMGDRDSQQSRDCFAMYEEGQALIEQTTSRYGA